MSHPVYVLRIWLILDVDRNGDTVTIRVNPDTNHLLIEENHPEDAEAAAKDTPSVTNQE